MNTLKPGDLIKNRNGVTRKVMEVYGTVLHISKAEDLNKFWQTTDEESLKDQGFTWDTPAWEPAINQSYWFIKGDGKISFSFWKDSKIDHVRRDFLGITETQELCVAALLEIRRKLGK